MEGVVAVNDLQYFHTLVCVVDFAFEDDSCAGEFVHEFGFSRVKRLLPTAQLFEFTLLPLDDFKLTLELLLMGFG